MRDEKEERSKQGQTNNKAKQHSTPKAVTFPNKNELPQVGLGTHDTQNALPAELPRQLSWLGPMYNVHVHVYNSGETTSNIAMFSSIFPSTSFPKP